MKTIYLFGTFGLELTAESLKKEMPKNSIEKLRIIIDSPGGSVSEGIRMHNLVKSYKGEVEMILGAMVASAAAYFAMAVPKEKRKAFENSSMMIHEASSAIRGRARDFKTMYDRLQGVNNIAADAFAADMGKTREEALALMSEDYYMTGWEQLLEHNIISDVISPKDVEFPEPTQEDFSWDFFFMQLENKQDKNIVKEKMYEAEEKALENWEKNNAEMGKMVALLNDYHTEKSKDDKSKIQQEEKMNLQEFLNSNPDAKAEREELLRSAEAKGIEGVESAVNAERSRIIAVLNKSDTVISETVLEALENGLTAEQYASAELDRQKQIRQNSSKPSFMSLAVKQTPAEQDTIQAAKAALTDEEIEIRAKALAEKLEKEKGGI